MVKKKVSFDIDQQLLSNIKEICRSKGIKLADFFREASEEKINSEKKYMAIYIPANGKVEQLQINRADYEIDLFEASHEMKINVGAACEGVLRVRPGTEMDKVDPLIKSIINFMPDKSVRFFTKLKYLDCREPNR